MKTSLNIYNLIRVQVSGFVNASFYQVNGRNLGVIAGRYSGAQSARLSVRIKVS